MSGRWVGGSRKRVARKSATGHGGSGAKRTRVTSHLAAGRSDQDAAVVEQLRRITQREEIDSRTKRALFLQTCQGARHGNESVPTSPSPPRGRIPMATSLVHGNVRERTQEPPSTLLVDSVSSPRYDRQRNDLLRLDDWTGIRRRNQSRPLETVSPRITEPDYPSPTKRQKHIFTPLKVSDAEATKDEAPASQALGSPAKSSVDEVDAFSSDQFSEDYLDFQDYRLAQLSREIEGLDAATNERPSALLSAQWHDQVGQVLEIHDRSRTPSAASTAKIDKPDGDLFSKYLLNMSPELREERQPSVGSEANSEASQGQDSNAQSPRSPGSPQIASDPIESTLSEARHSLADAEASTTHVGRQYSLGELGIALVLAQQSFPAPSTSLSDAHRHIATASSPPPPPPPHSSATSPRPRLVESRGHAQLFFPAVENAFTLTPPDFGLS